MSITLDVGYEPLLLLIERAGVFLRKQLGEAENGIERRPQFVAHTRQKLAFEPVGPLHFAVLQGERLIGA